MHGSWNMRELEGGDMLLIRLTNSRNHCYAINILSFPLPPPSSSSSPPPPHTHTHKVTALSTLIQRGVDVTMEDYEGLRPLDLARDNYHTQCAQLLFKALQPTLLVSVRSRSQTQFQ